MREGGVLARALGCLGGSSSQHGEPLGWGVRQAEVGPHGCPAHLGTAGRRTRVSSPRCLCLGRLCLTLGKVVPACGVDVGACVRLAGVRGRLDSPVGGARVDLWVPVCARVCAPRVWHPRWRASVCFCKRGSGSLCLHPSVPVPAPRPRSVGAPRVLQGL